MSGLVVFPTFFNLSLNLAIGVHDLSHSWIQVLFWSNRCWQFHIWVLCLSLIQLEHLEVFGLYTTEVWLGEFWSFLSYSVKWVKLCGSLNILWHCLSSELEWKMTFSSPVEAAEFSKFAGILKVALSQHHLLGFEIAQLEFYHFC